MPHLSQKTRFSKNARFGRLWRAENFEERQKGSIEVGKAADFVILDRDLLDEPKKRILNAKIVATILDGNIVYSNRIN